MRPGLAALLFVLSAEAAGAGAWTLDRGSVQVFSGAIASRATERFDDAGGTTEKTVFNKLLIQNTMEYGLTDAVTLFVAPEYVTAQMSGANFHSASFEAGARVLLFSRIGMLSLQSSAKSAGAFDMSTSAGGEAGRQLELRLLYGDSFKLFGLDAFVDVEAAHRWIAKPRPGELDLDASAGCWLTKSTEVLLQSFNMASTGRAVVPYQDYRLHKLQASLVQRLYGRWWLQTGYFYSPAGRNIVREQGLVAEIWYRA